MNVTDRLSVPIRHFTDLIPKIWQIHKQVSCCIFCNSWIAGTKCGTESSTRTAFFYERRYVEINTQGIIYIYSLLRPNTRNEIRNPTPPKRREIRTGIWRFLTAYGRCLRRVGYTFGGRLGTKGTIPFPIPYYLCSCTCTTCCIYLYWSCCMPAVVLLCCIW